MTNQELQKIGNTILKREADNNNDGLVSKNKYNNFPWICKKKGDEVIREFMKTPEPVKPTSLQEYRDDMMEAEDLDNRFLDTLIEETKEEPIYNLRLNPGPPDRYSPEDFRNKKLRKPKVKLKKKN